MAEPQLSENLYDDFGNYIGPDLEDEDNSGEEDSDEDSDDWIDEPEDAEEDDGLTSLDPDTDMAAKGAEASSVVLYEDKSYYPMASEVYPEAEVLVQEEDTQPLETPIIAPVKTKKFMLVERELPPTNFDFRFLCGLMDHPVMIRNVCLLGNLHCGKTQLMDMFVKQTHLKKWDLEKEVHYTDTRIDEQQRGLSIKAMPMSLVMQSLSGKSFLCNVMDAPGHVNFSDEATTAIRISDGAVIVVDAAEGVMAQTSRMLKHAASEKLPIVLVINKMDRLIIELKLPPTDAYHKLCHTLEEVNNILEKCGSDQRVSPQLGNVAFASALHSWIFTIPSFAKNYADYHQNFPAKEFTKRLWGNYYLKADRSFSKSPKGAESGKRTFVEFILEPLYKMYSYVLGSEGSELQSVLDELGVKLKRDQYNLDAKPMLKLVCYMFA